MHCESEESIKNRKDADGLRLAIEVAKYGQDGEEENLPK
jgi:hypothetical protein